MKIVYGKNLEAQDLLQINNIKDAFDLSPETARLLYSRGVDSVEKARQFLFPNKSGFYNPFLLSGMQEAVERIKRAKDLKESVLIFGDYDADGTCAAAILYFCLKEYGITARTTVPERENGYGLNVDVVREFNAQSKIDLLITVDCGISDKDKIEILKSEGIDVIVTDHHEPPEDLPDCIRINPKLKNQEYPFNGLCGAGVAYKLGYALIGDRADYHLDYTALATAADSMELIDENRCIVAEGLRLMNQSPRQVFKCLVSDSSKKITSQTLVFQIAPRLNAGGRMGDANVALKALIEREPNKINEYCERLGEYNVARQRECDEIYKQARAKIMEEKSYEDGVIVVAGEDYKTGFIGIVAARLLEDFNRPVIVFAGQEGTYKGSARSVEGINIYDIINSAKELLATFGGHSQAAGLSLEKDKLELFRKRVNDYAKQNNLARYAEKTVFAEWQITDKISMKFVRELELLEPFGVGNIKPNFAVNISGAVHAEKIKPATNYFRFETSFIDMFDFDGKQNAEILSLPIAKTVVFELNYSVYKGKEYKKGFVKSVSLEGGDLTAAKPYIIRNEILALAGETPGKVSYLENLPKVKNGFGTLYVISDVDNLKSCDIEDGILTYVYNPPKGNRNCIVAGYNGGAIGYERLVYLDMPLSLSRLYGETAEIFACDKLSGKAFVDEISLDREVFGRAYSYMRSLSGKLYGNSAEAYLRYNPPFSMAQFIFCMEVFDELEFFFCYQKDGKLKISEIEDKKPLTTSCLYSKIADIKKYRLG